MCASTVSQSAQLPVSDQGPSVMLDSVNQIRPELVTRYVRLPEKVKPSEATELLRSPAVNCLSSP